MVDIVTRLGKGSPLTNAEVDANFTNLAEVSGVTGEPMGHEDRTTSTISFNASTRTFTIAPTASSFTVWCKGKKVVVSSAQTVVIPNTTGMHSIYYDANGTLSSKIGYFTFAEEAPTAYVYWNATTGAAPYFGDERHGVVLDWQTHEYLHRTRGAVIANGFLASGYTLNSSATNAATQIAIESGTFFDEDMKIDIVSTATPTAGTYQQNLLFPAKIPVLHLQGTSWVMDAPTDFPFKQGTSRPQYNSLSGGVWSTTDVGNNQHATTWILATNNLTYPVIAIIGQSATDNLGEAEAFSFADLTLTGFPSVEFRPLYKLIYKASDGYANSVNAQLVSIVDLRSISAVGSAANPATDHGNLSGLSDDDHPQYLSVDTVRGSLTAAVKASFLPSQTSNAGKFLQTDGTATSWQALTSGNVTTALGFTPYNATNPSGYISGISSSDVTTALGFTPYNATNPSGYVNAAGARGSISVTGAGSYDSATGVINIVGGVTSFNTRTGAITLSSSDVTTALGFTPYNSTNPNGYLTGITSTQVTTALGYTPYNSSNPSGYITGITSGMVTTALGFTPYNNSNPSGYITSAALSPYLTTASAASTYLALAGGTIAGQLVIGAVGTANSPTLRLNTSSSGAFVHTQENFAANLTSGQHIISVIGKVGNTKNSGYIGYTWAGDASNSNFVTIGHWGNDDLFRVYADGNVTVGTNTVLSAGNYNSYSPTLTGTGASGTWGISISGNAATVTNGLYKVGTNAIPAAVVLNTTADNWMWLWQASSGNDWYLGPTTANFGIGGSRLAFSSSGSSPAAELSIERGTTRLLEILQANLQYKGNVVLHAANYNSYSPTLTGTGASGTWGISISGSASSASAVSWTGVSSGSRTNYDLGFKPPSSGWAGFYFGKSTSSAGASDAGYLLIRGTSDVFPPYTAEGITLVSDANSLNLFARCSNLVAGGNAWVRMGTGETETFRLMGDYSLSLNSSRAPIFYDSNDTGYYVDPASTSNLNSTIGQAFRIGTDSAWKIRGNSGNVELAFEYSTSSTLGDGNIRAYLSGSTFVANGDVRAPIFYDSNNTGTYINPNGASVISSGGSYPLQLTSTQRYIARFYNSSATGAGWWLANDAYTLVFHADSSGDKASLNTDGVFITTGSVRTPIFYDSNDTAYYTDPASTSNVNLLHAQSIVVTGTTTDRNVVRVIPKGASASYNNTVTGAFKIRLPIRANDTMWRMTVKIYNYSENNISEYNLGNYSYSAGSYNSAASFNGSNNATARTVRFGNDGSYDCVWIGETGGTWSHPVIAVTDFVGGYANASGGNWDDNWDISLATSFGTVAGTITPANRFYAVTTDSSMYSPIYYDSNDTGYYVDPNSSGTCFKGYGTVDSRAGFTSIGNPWGTSNSAYFPNGITTAGGTNWVYGFTYVGNAPANGAGHEFATDGSMRSTSSHRATIYYDDSDTGYYTNPNSTSNVLSIYAENSLVRIEKVHAEGGEIRFLSADSSTGGWIQGHSGGLRTVDHGWTQTTWNIDNSGNSIATSSHRAPIFYDSGDTGYYINANGSSSLYGLVLSGNQYFRPNTWIQMDTSAGIYWPNHYGAHLYPNTGSTYTQLQIDGSKNGYSGMYISHSAVNGMMYDSSGNGGVYREAQGRWYWYHHLGNNCMGVGTATTSSTYGMYVVKGGYFDGRVDGTIFYDANDTGYYLNPNSTTALRTVGSWRADSAAWDGEFSGKIQYHSSNWYFQYAGSALFRNSGGSNIFTIDQSGNVVASNNVTAYSDARLKENVVTIDSALDKVLRLRGVYYNKIGNPERRVGVIAQETEIVLPEVVRSVSDTNPLTGETTELLAVDYGNISGLLIEAMKEQDKEVVDLRNRVAQLESLIHKLIGD